MLTCMRKSFFHKARSIPLAFGGVKIFIREGSLQREQRTILSPFFFSRVAIRTSRATTLLKMRHRDTHTTLAHCATCRGCLHLRVGQHNSPNRNDTKNGHTTRCTHEKLSKMSKNSGTVHCRGHRAMLIYTRKYFSVTISIDCVLYSPLGLAQTAVKSGTTPHFRSPGTAKDGGARWGRAWGNPKRCTC